MKVSPLKKRLTIIPFSMSTTRQICLHILTVLISHGAIHRPLCHVHGPRSQSLKGPRINPKKGEGVHLEIGLLTTAHYIGRKHYVTPKFSGVPTARRGKKKEIRIGCHTPALSGAQKRAEMLRYPCFLGVDQRQARGEKAITLPASPLPCWGPKRGGKCYVTPAVSGVLKKGDKNGPRRAGEKGP